MLALHHLSPCNRPIFLLYGKWHQVYCCLHQRFCHVLPCTAIPITREIDGQTDKSRQWLFFFCVGGFCFTMVLNTFFDMNSWDICERWLRKKCLRASNKFVGDFNLNCVLVFAVDYSDFCCWCFCFCPVFRHSGPMFLYFFVWMMEGNTIIGYQMDAWKHNTVWSTRWAFVPFPRVNLLLNWKFVEIYCYFSCLFSSFDLKFVEFEESPIFGPKYTKLKDAKLESEKYERGWWEFGS